MWNFGLNISISECNIYGNYNLVIYINIIGLDRKHYSLFGSLTNINGRYHYSEKNIHLGIDIQTIKF